MATPFEGEIDTSLPVARGSAMLSERREAPSLGDRGAQPILASAIRAVDRLVELGETVGAGLPAALRTLSSRPVTDIPGQVRALLGSLELLELEVGPGGPVAVRQLGGPATLMQGGWRSFLVCVLNPHAVESAFAVTGGGSLITTPTASGMVTRPYLPDQVEYASTIRDQWWYEALLDGAGILSGRALEYHILSVYSRDAGTRSALVRFSTPALKDPRFAQGDAWERTQRHRAHLASVAQIELRLEIAPSHDVVLDVRDSDGRSCVASITVRDDLDRVYPSRGLRLAPDMMFQDQVYRATGESVRLPAGRYTVTGWRGPEYRPVVSQLIVDPAAEPGPFSIGLDRWVDPAAHGYYSGDVHLHAGGCSHYSLPTEGVTPETMIRHARGEGLWVSSVLTWGPCYYYQKQFFTGHSISPAATLEFPDHQQAQGVTWEPRPTAHDDESALRYDIEVSGFPSSHSGHLVLLGLSEQDYPGVSTLEDWPSWNLPIHRWARGQGALTGFAHCGSGMGTPSRELPNYEIPPFSAMGANELVVDAAHDAVDFVAGVEFGIAAEMNTWYHLLNVGYRTLMVGETDFPCISDERPGIGRTYVSLPAGPKGERAIEDWIAGLRTQPSYFGEGRSHAFDFSVDGDSRREQRREAPGSVKVTATIAALLPAQRPEPTIEEFTYDLAPDDLSVPNSRPNEWGYWEPSSWHLEWARIGQSRSVPVELVVNGLTVAATEIVADGTEQDVVFDIELQRSSWVAVRILPSMHTQPIFVEVGSRPIRASRRSAQWLYDCVEKLWTVKNGFIRPAERRAARDAYDHALAVYARRRDESEVD